MNNWRHAAKPWLRMLGLCPLLVIDLGIYDALLFGVAVLATLFFTNAAMALLQRWLVEAQRLLATALLAALVSGMLDLVLQTICYSHAHALQLYMPLLVIAPLLFYKTDNTEPLSLPRTLTEALLGGSAFAGALAVTALLRAALPGEIAIPIGLLASGLWLALANRIDPPQDPNPGDAQQHTARVRARVTGPVR